MSKVLADIQAKIKAPKDKENTFGKYKYRNAESILAAFKEVQPEGVALTMSDEVVMVGSRMFLVAKVFLWADGGVIASATSAAMHATEKKGMDDAQITGACSSYARKYALCGLFAIDDSTDDPDGHDNRDGGKAKTAPKNNEANTRRDEPPKATPSHIADRLIQRFGEFTMLADMQAFAGPDQPAGQAWDKLAKDDPAQSDRVKAAYDKRAAELGGV
jgi:hypothetical protein